MEEPIWMSNFLCILRSLQMSENLLIFLLCNLVRNQLIFSFLNYKKVKNINEASQNALHFFANVIWSSWNINALNMDCCFYVTEKKIRKFKFLLYVIKTMYHREFMKELVYSIPTVLNHVFLQDTYESIQIFMCAYVSVKL